MFDIAQVYGIRLDKLLEMNGLRRGQEPETNETVRIRGKNKRPIKIKDAMNENAPVQPTKKPRPTSPVVEDGELDFEIGPGTTPEKPRTTPTSKPDSRPTTPPKPPATTPERPYDNDPTPNTKPTPPRDPAAESEGPAPRGYHRVVKGDTLFRLSKEYNLTVERLKQLNNLPNSDIKIGQLLKVQ
jgi:LysM repeat protein